MRPTAVDTSVAVPLVHAGHPDHLRLRQALIQDDLHLSGHAAVESYSVLTRLPGDLRLQPEDAAALLDDAFGDTLSLPVDAADAAYRHLAAAGVAGGATYDGLVALAARAHDATLLTRDARARSTYVSLGVQVQTVLV